MVFATFGGVGHHWMPPTVWAWVGLGWLGMGFEPRFWLHWRQVTRALSMVSRPPRAAGTTWSGSGLRGWSVVPHASGCPQSGQWVCPLACARWRTRTRQRLWRAVPVREVPGRGVMRTSVARPPTSCGPGAPTSWCARGRAAGWWVSSRLAVWLCYSVASTFVGWGGFLLHLVTLLLQPCYALLRGFFVGILRNFTLLVTRRLIFPIRVVLDFY